MSLVRTLSLLALLPLVSADGFAADWRTEAERSESEGALDAAVVLAERHLAERPDDAEAWRWLAGAIERLVETRGRSALLYSESAEAWERAARLEPEDAGAWLAAGRNRLRVGEAGAAEALLARALELEGRRAEGVSGAAAALAFRARAARERAEAPPDRGALARGLLDVRQRGAELERLAPLERAGGALLAAEAGWLSSLDLGDLALARLADALERAPADVALHKAWVELFVRLGLEERLAAAYAELAARHPEVAEVAWYRGYALRIAADRAAEERRNDDAVEGYGECVRAMRRAAELEPEFAETARWIEMQARSAQGWSQLDADDVAGADATWSSLVEEAPEFAGRLDGLWRTPAQGLGRLGGRYHVRDDLNAAQRVARTVADATADPWAWNNVGYLLRELASDAEEGGDPTAFDVARSTFRESWRAYLKAAEMAPDEPRIVNDTALIQVYHLQDDLDAAERLLQEAVRVGEQRLAALGPDPDESLRFPLAQAVGDAYQNLGFLHYRLKDDPVRARAFFVKSLETDSGARGGVRASLRAIDERGAPGLLVPVTPGTGGPEGTRGAGGTGAPPRPGVPDPGNPDLALRRGPAGGGAPPPSGPDRPQPSTSPEPPAPSLVPVDWEADLDEALAAGSREGRPVLLYHRAGGGIGPSVEFLQRYLTSDHFARATAGAITLLADRLRHTFVDRRRDGRRVECPRAPGLACVEHMACAAEFERRWHATGGGRLGLESNGLFVVGADGFTRVGEMQDTFERFRPDRDPEQASEVRGLPDVLPGSAPPDRSSWRTAEELAQSGRLGARRELERRVFDPASPEERRAAVAALAERPSSANDELLTAAADQLEDAELALLALGGWRAALGPETPLRALQASTDSRVRRRAAEVLARFGETTSERALVARWVLARPAAPTEDELRELTTADLARIAADVAR